MDEITYSFLNLNGATLEVWEWISNFIPRLIIYVISYPCWAVQLGCVIAMSNIT